MEHEIYLALPLTREEAAHLYLTVKEKGDMLRHIARSNDDPINELLFLNLNNQVMDKLEPWITCLGIESDSNRTRGPRWAPAGYR